MAKENSSLKVTEDQALHFRSRRAHLTGVGAANPVVAARDILGAQSQQIGPSLHGLSLRTKGRPTAAQLEEEIHGTGRRLMRTWGQRDTIHVYEPTTDWPLILAARTLWAPGSRRGIIPPESAIAKAVQILRKEARAITRSDVFAATTKKMIREAEEKVGTKGDMALRGAAGRFFWMLAQRGQICFANKIGAEQYFAAREAWFPKLRWPDLEPAQAAATLVERYLRLSAPATPADIGHFFGARIGDVRSWLDALGSKKLVDVECGGRKGLLALKKDTTELKRKAPTRLSEWPLRILPMWDAHLMAHANKTWLAPHGADEKRIWKAAAVVKPAVLVRGRIVATWSHKKKKKRLEVVVEPLVAWSAFRHGAGVRREAQALARHLELESVDVRWGP